MRACLSGGCASCATANIPSPRHRAEKEPLEQSRLLTCCNLTRKRKRTRPCNDCPTSSLHMILRVAPDACLIKLDHRATGARASVLKPKIPCHLHGAIVRRLIISALDRARFSSNPQQCRTEVCYFDQLRERDAN